MIEFELSPAEVLHPRITVIGVGGAGGNAVARMMANNARGIEFILANTDAQALNGASRGRTLQLGRTVTEGLGAGSVAAIGKAAAEESIEEIGAAIDGAHMCFIAAGMGGGTGTGAAPVIARLAREKGILTVAVVTTPFAFEGCRRARHAQDGIEELQKHADTLIVIPNQNLFRVANPHTTFKEAFAMADEVLQQGVRGITDLMVMPGLVNLDFADVRSIMGAMGKAMMGSGEASGEDRAMVAAELAISNPLLDGAINGARGMIISIIGGEDMRLTEIDAAATHMKDLIDPEADIIWGSAIDPAFEGRMRVSIVATGLDLEAQPAVRVAAPCPSPEAFPAPVPEIARPVAPPVAAIVDARLSEPALARAQPQPDLFHSSTGSFANPGGDGATPRHEPSPVSPSRAIVIPPAPEPQGAARPPVHASSLFERMVQMVRSVANIEASHTVPSTRKQLDSPGVYSRPRRVTRGPESGSGARLVGIHASTGVATG